MRLPLVLLISLILPTVTWAKSSSVDDRISRLENIVENGLSFDLLAQLEAMQQEVRELRGQIEEQQNELQVLHKKQESLYLSLDARMNNLPAANPPAADLSHTQSQANTEKYYYDAAYKLIGAKKYIEAIAEFKSLLAQYPQGVYVANSHYWLGEIYFAQWNQNRANKDLVKQAVESFNVVVEQHATHHKAADALLRLGMIEMEQENWLVAKDLLTKVVQQYPGSSRSSLASAKLQRMKQDGHTK